MLIEMIHLRDEFCAEDEGVRAGELRFGEVEVNSPVVPRVGDLICVERWVAICRVVEVVWHLDVDVPSVTLNLDDADSDELYEDEALNAVGMARRATSDAIHAFAVIEHRMKRQIRELEAQIKES